MEDYTEKEINEYLDYFASHVIILSDYIKKNDINNKNIIQQHLDEMGESLQSILSIVGHHNEVYGDMSIDRKDKSIIKIIRDFKIGKIMDERNK